MEKEIINLTNVSIEHQSFPKCAIKNIKYEVRPNCLNCIIFYVSLAIHAFFLQGG